MPPRLSEYSLQLYTVALDLIGVPNMQYDNVRLDSVKTVFRVVTPEYRVPKSN